MNLSNIISTVCKNDNTLTIKSDEIIYTKDNEEESCSMVIKYGKNDVNKTVEDALESLYKAEKAIEPAMLSNFTVNVLITQLLSIESAFFYSDYNEYVEACEDGLITEDELNDVGPIFHQCPRDKKVAFWDAANGMYFNPCSNMLYAYDLMKHYGVTISYAGDKPYATLNHITVGDENDCRAICMVILINEGLITNENEQ